MYVADTSMHGAYSALAMPPEMAPEFGHLFELFRKCLHLRDKYMTVSRQRLGDNPRDHDGVFQGIADNCADVQGVRPSADYSKLDPPADKADNFEPWRIYPKPPPPHWHWSSTQDPPSNHAPQDEDHMKPFEFSACDIPAQHVWDFEIDEKGVYQVYEFPGGQ